MTTVQTHLQKAIPYLSQYSNKKVTDDAIIIKVTPFTTGYHTQHISDLLAGMGYSIVGDDEKDLVTVK